MEDLENDPPQAEPTTVPSVPIPLDVEPQPAEDVTAPKFLFSMNSKPLKEEGIE